MKKRLSNGATGNQVALWICVAVLLVLLGCGGSENNSKDEGKTNPTSDTDNSLSMAELVGTYGLSGFSQTDTRDGITTDQNGVDQWWGQMVITSAGRLYFKMILNDEEFNFIWDITEIESDALKIQEGDCIDWVDIERKENYLTIMWPQGDCSQHYSWTWSFYKISPSQEFPPIDPVPGNGGSYTGQALTLTDLVGSYDLTGFSMTDVSDGFTINQEDYPVWSGRMVINSDGLIQFTQIVEAQTYNFQWEILVVENHRLQLREEDCVQWVILNYIEDYLTLTWPEAECMENLQATFHFSKESASTVTSLQTHALRFRPAISQKMDKLADLFKNLVD